MNGEMQDTSSSANESQKMNPVIIGIVVLVIALVGFYALKSMGSENSAATSTDGAMTGESINTQPTSDEAVPGSVQNDPSMVGGDAATDTTETADGVRIINVEAGGFYYTPNEIRVKKGETVRIVMNSVDMMHDFNIDELNVKLPITKDGETNSVEFTADTVGEFEYYCSVGQHRANGQIGTLIVEE